MARRYVRLLLLASVAGGAFSPAIAGPVGGQVTTGSGSIRQAGDTTTITQTSANLSLSWQGFNTSAAETVNFIQPSTSAIAVNRILDANPTQFLGHLNATGQVYLINPNGILFGRNAQVNVGGLVASTLDISDADLAGATRSFRGEGSGRIVNQGTITAANGGYIAFIGNSVSNQGSIAAPGGTVALGAGSDVTLAFAGDSLVKLQINHSTLDTLADNGGLIQADGGTVLLSAGAKDAVLASVVNNSGIVQAHSVRDVNGTIVLEGGDVGSVANSGTLDASASGAGQTGGTVKMLGEQVTLAATGRIDASGLAGGGTVLVGGNFKGAGPERNATSTTIAAGGTIVADALDDGKGGQVAIWSDTDTSFNGTISARGGASGGDGGSVETSGAHLTVSHEASVVTLAPRGTTGNWLLDPDDFTIYSDGYGTGDIESMDLTAALQSSNVTIKTGAHTTCDAGLSCMGHTGNGDIILAEGVLIGGSNWTSGTTLTLSAYRNIELLRFANIDTSSGTGSMVLRADNTGTGTGTVILSNESNIYGNSTGTIKIYYNPTSYASPTDYAGLTDASGDLLIRMPDQSKLSSYMYVNLAPTVANKTYDGGTAASVTSTAVRGGTPSDVTVDTSSATATFADKNVSDGKTVTVTGITLSGSGASKYALNGLDSSTADITKRDLALSGISASNKTYDGTTAATITGSAVVSAFGSDVVGVAGSGTGSSFADKNAGTNKAVTVTGYSLTGADAGNYNLVVPTSLTADIAKASLSVTGITANGRTYDGTTNATLSGTAVVSALGSDVVNVTGVGSGTFADKNAGSGKAVTVTGYTLGGTDAGNYDVVQPTGLTATINKASLSLGGVSVEDKVYDGTTAATLTGTATVAGIGGDDVSVSGSGSATFADKNAGTDKAVTVSGYALGGIDAGNYVLAPASGLTASIIKADLALSGISASNKTYDGTTAATITGSAVVSAFGSDVVSVAGSGAGSTFADKNAGTNKAVTVSGYTLTGADAGNYNLVAPTNLTADIARASLSVTGVATNSRTYDGTMNATLSGTAAVAAFGSDAVTVTGAASATFADKNAGSGKAVTVTGYTLGGTDAGNYDVVQPTGLTATINKASLSLGGVSVVDKVYDGTTAATLTGTAAVTGIAGDDVSVTGSGSGSFVDKNVGTNKTVTVSGYTLGGHDADNYMLAPSGGLTARISKADLALSGISASNKTYDATTSATITGSAVVSVLGGDVVSVAGSGAGSTFADKNAGTNKAVTVSGYTLTGADAGNYNLVAPTNLTADIARASLSVTGVAANSRNYDSTTNATLSGTAAVSALGSDVVTVTDTGSGTFADKNAGSGKVVTVTGYTLGGTDAGNYDVVQPTGLTATINKAAIALAGISVADKVYDGTTSATLAGVPTIAGFGGDDISVTGSGSAVFIDKNAGTNKAVPVSGYTLTGADAGNYNLVVPTNLTADIARASLTVTGVTANSRDYDGTTNATLGGAAAVSALGGDVVTVTDTGSGTFADKNVATNKAVTVSGYALGGADAGNYNLVQPQGLTATITRAALLVTGVAATNKTYDGTTAATLAGTARVAGYGNDDVAIGGTGVGAFENRNADAGTAVLVTGYTLAGADAGNYALVQPTGLTATITRAELIVGGLSVGDKVYDGTAAAQLAGTASVTPLAGDAVTLAGTGTAIFADKNAGAVKAVSVAGYTLSGADAANYLLLPVSGLTAAITPATIRVSGIVANDRTYDGTTAATLSGMASVSGIAGDAVAVTGNAVGRFVDRNAGTDKAVLVSGYALTGADAGNYLLVQPSLAASISRASLIVTGVTALDKTYDATTAAALSGVARVSPLTGDEVAVSGTGVGQFADKNAGSAKPVSVSGYTLTGIDAGNYAIIQPSGLAATIAPASITVTGVRANGRAYNSTTTITLSGTAVLASHAGDQVTLIGSASGSIADKTVGTGKAVSVTGYALAGDDATNYTLRQPTGLTVDISRAVLTIAGITASDKVYDGTTTASVSVANATLAGRIGADAVTIAATGTFADPAVGSNKVVTLAASYGGPDVGNYAIVDQGTTTASITAAVSAPAITAADEGEIRHAVAQIQTAALPATATLTRQGLIAASTIILTQTDQDSQGDADHVPVSASIGYGSGAPMLRIQNGGTKLPAHADAISQ